MQWLRPLRHSDIFTDVITVPGTSAYRKSNMAANELQKIYILFCIIIIILLTPNQYKKYTGKTSIYKEYTKDIWAKGRGWGRG
jgi:hypothetical protein